MTAISIVIPVFNAADYIEECIGSIASQSFDDYEVIIIDDGSTDGTDAICDCLAESDERIRVVHIENAGASNARNTGAALARGGYIWFVDADDLIAEGALERLHQEIERTQADCIMFDSVRFYKDDRCVYAPLFAEGFFANDGDAVNEVQRFFLYPYGSRLYNKQTSTGYVAPWSKVFKVDLIQTGGIEFDRDLRIYEDGLFTLKIFDRVKSVEYIAEPLYRYRFLGDSAIHSYSTSLSEERLAAFRAVDEWLRHTDKDESYRKAYHAHVVSYTGGLLSRYFFHPSHDPADKNAGREIKAYLSEDPIRGAFKEVDLSALKIKDKALAIFGRIRSIFGMRLYYFAKLLFEYRKGRG